jgi:dihydrofolate synthase/folylpolyglutamate synthase
VRPNLIVDAAHNGAAARALTGFLSGVTNRGRGAVLVVGMLAGHDPVDFLGNLTGTGAVEVVITAPRDPRALTIEELQDAARRIGLRHSVSPTVAAAVQRAERLVGRHGVIVACGSFAVAREAKAARCP